MCGQHGYAGSNDGFSSIGDDINRRINSAFDSSISHCEANNLQIMYHERGYIYIKSVNFSHNKASERSALCCAPNQINDGTNHGSDVLYCSFFNNTATQNCIYFTSYDSADKSEIKNCNIIENNSTKTIHSGREITIYLSSFINNISPYFSMANTNSKIILTLCYIDKTESELGSISQNENQTSDSSILSLPYFQTGFCDISFHHCTENSLFHNLYIQKIIIPSPFIFLLLSKRS